MLSFVFLVALGLVGSARSDGTLDIRASLDGFTDKGIQVSVNCNFASSTSPPPEGKSRESRHVALTLSKKGNTGSAYEDVASINSFSPAGQVTTAENFQGRAEGSFDSGSDVQSSSLRVTFEGVNPEELGEFRCEAAGLGRFGRCVEESKSANLTLLGSSLAGFLKANERGDDAEKYKSAMERLHRKHAAIIKSLDKDDDLYWITGLFNMSSYYALTDNKEFCVDQDKLGGELAEINTEEEFLFLEETLSKPEFAFPSGVSYALTGAKFEELKGPFRFVGHPGHKVYTGHWADDEPDRSSLRYSWIILGVKGGRLYMHDGIDKSSDLKYLCEVTF